jgi:uncharacterized membrane protein
MGAELVLLTALVIIWLAVVIGLMWVIVRRQRSGVAYEVRVAQWQLQQLTRQAMRRMLDEARRSHGRTE